MSKYSNFNTNPYSVHQRIINYIGKNKKVLDVGCSEGLLSKKMHENNCSVVGIELNMEAAKKAKIFCKEIIIGDVELTVGDLDKFPRLFRSIGMFWPNLFAYQFFIVAKKA